MGLRPFWKRHPYLLRISAAAMLLFFPLTLAVCILWAAWEVKGDIAEVFRDLWRYATGKDC